MNDGNEIPSPGLAATLSPSDGVSGVTRDWSFDIHFGVRSKADMKSTTLGLGIVLAIGLVQAEDLSRWKYSQELVLDTSTAGANVAGEVRNFPLAVALGTNNFDFSQAQPDGADLRFSLERNGPPLPHHIESWGGTNPAAIIWVKIPLVHGNRADQKLFLHWGNASAKASGNSAAVFDTSEGWIGVWHLSDEGGMEEGGYRDATANAAHGTGINMARSSRGDGRVGKAANFRYPANQWIRVGGPKRTIFDITNQLTFSIWAKARGYGNKGDEKMRSLPGYETMFAKGDNSWRLQKFGIRSWHNPPAELIEICVEQPPRADLCVVGKTEMATNQWYHFVGVHDHPKVRLYVNGVLDKEETFDVPWRSDDHAVGIGNQSQFPDRGRQWDGWLDEARVLRVAKDAHWIRLDYESQREGQKLLRFGPTGRRF